jgi:NADPH:quinone reductase
MPQVKFHNQNSTSAYKVCAVMYKFFERGLIKGWLRRHPFEFVPGGLGGIEGALRDLKTGKGSAVKYVFKIDETQGLF